MPAGAFSASKIVYPGYFRGQNSDFCVFARHNGDFGEVGSTQVSSGSVEGRLSRVVAGGGEVRNYTNRGSWGGQQEGQKEHITSHTPMTPLGSADLGGALRDFFLRSGPKIEILFTAVG